ncbi:endonuclease/exonuclease/phosphatase family protein [Pedobacter cryoconitis]|uniref:Endonuclease/exonuclease/phosphatase family metal-dependent hydrolase n=1 Tax=Pedobacter cryoconitis TaxID=188932 RepID=A0A7X0J7Q0_9SPHI|nr:endonuclease/exonuclease/phosphatase family protein [Pedobacter cryoconitis]MBB6502630.1 endonuclease/exonuclease/phosphatase family metal-dependent hydrolase [Pedobacter cryoconitis]
MFKQYICRISIIAILVLLSGKAAMAQTPVKIISYNVYNYFEGEKDRKQKFINWAKLQQADVIAYQELLNISAAELESLGKAIGHPYTELAKEQGYSVGITSRFPIKNVKKIIKGMHHGFMLAQIGNLQFAVVHFSPFSYQKRQQEVAMVVDSLGGSSKKTIVLGDMNSYAASDSAYYKRNDRLNQLLKGDESSHITNVNNGKLDYSVTGYLMNKGFVDSWRLKRINFDNSYPSRVSGTVLNSARERIDFIFISPDLQAKVVKSLVIKDQITAELSDHYPVSIWLDLPGL